MTSRLHLDTDLGGDPDDLAALALALAHPDIDLVGVTTTADPGGVRAGLVTHALQVAGRRDVSVVAGAEGSLTHDRVALPLLDSRFWPAGIAPRPAPEPEAAAERLARAIDDGVTVVAIGPLTNLARLERRRPGALAGARVVAMGGWVRPLAPGLPDWGPARDSNVAWDPVAARVVLEAAGELTLVTLADTLRVHLRARHLPRLRAAGALGPLLAEQALAYAADRGHAALAASHAALPDDLLVFLHDPLTVAVAAGWPGARMGTERVALRGDAIVAAEGGREVALVTDVDAGGFADWWLETVTAPRPG